MNDPQRPNFRIERAQPVAGPGIDEGPLLSHEPQPQFHQAPATEVAKQRRRNTQTLAEMGLQTGRRHPVRSALDVPTVITVLEMFNNLEPKSRKAVLDVLNRLFG